MAEVARDAIPPPRIGYDQTQSDTDLPAVDEAIVALEATRRVESRTRKESVIVFLQQAAVGVAVLIIWEILGRVLGSTWISRPTLIGLRLVEWAREGLLYQIGVTIFEIIIGMLVGLPLGVLAGFVLGSSRLLADVLKPLIMAVYTIPFVGLAPFLIFVFGLGMAPKIFLVAVVSFFLLLFTTFAGMLAIDEDLVLNLEIMGCSRFEKFRKLILPACMVWIMSGLKTALPFALISATAGEMLAPGAGIGSALMTATSQFDMTLYYTGLLIVAVLGLIVSGFVLRLENWLLRWRGREN
jgi:NitT/TauT family transport system permease protein